MILNASLLLEEAPEHSQCECISEQALWGPSQVSDMLLRSFTRRMKAAGACRSNFTYAWQGVKPVSDLASVAFAELLPVSTQQQLVIALAEAFRQHEV